MNTHLDYITKLKNSEYLFILYDVFREDLENNLYILEKILPEEELQAIRFLHATELGQKLYKRYQEKELLELKELIEEDKKFIAWAIKRYPEKLEYLKRGLLINNYWLFLLNRRINRNYLENGWNKISRKSTFTRGSYQTNRK